jgi:hypothetical protein
MYRTLERKCDPPRHVYYGKPLEGKPRKLEPYATCAERRSACGQETVAP